MPTSISDHPVARLPEEWREHLAEHGEKAFRAQQIFRWIHARSLFDPQGMTDLSKSLRGKLHAWGCAAPMEVTRVHRASDGTRKALVTMNDGTSVETVLLPRTPALQHDADVAAQDVASEEDASEEDAGNVDAGEDDEPLVRVTQCISSQVGCAMGCVFCASGVAGLKRHMTAAEIVAQVLLGRTLLEGGEKLSGVVFMGMGEPLHNYDALVRAIRLMTHPDGLGLSPRRITVSTAGLAPQITRLGEDFDGRVGLAFSLHNADDAKRSALVPLNDKHPLREVMAALKSYRLPWGRRITIEYTLVRGQNDSVDDARRVADLLRDLKVKINLIPMNPIAASQLGPPQQAQIRSFQDVLRRAGYSCFVRRRRGDDVAAACGQLALLGGKATRSFMKRQP